MNKVNMNPIALVKYLTIAGACLALIACSGSSRPKPVDIPSVSVQQEVRPSWNARIGEVDFPLVVSAREDRVALADKNGLVTVLEAKTGRDIWRVKLEEPIAAGVGSDGQQVAVVTKENQLVTMLDGKVQWRQTLPAQSFTPPLVAGARIFVLTADRAVIAFDGGTGRKLWTQQRPGEPLVLKQAGVLLPYKDTLVAGLSGRLVGLDPNTGSIRWESAIATPRGTNDIERLVDLVAPYDRLAETICVRAFQAAIGCVNAERGQSIWTRSSVGDQGVSGDANVLIAPLSNGVVQAWKRGDGERLWETDRLKYRMLKAPLVTPRGILVTDNAGWLYLLSLTDGSLLNRLKLDGVEFAAPPVVAGDHFVVVSREGRVSGLLIP